MSIARVEEERLTRDIEAIASFNEADPRLGYSRPTFSPAWRRARDYAIVQAEAAGCASWVDAAGNVHARARAVGESKRAWLCGSHIDSVPTGGKFDGVVGVVVALEVLRVAPDAPVELVVFAEEEGTTFGLGMVGSKAWAGTLSAERLRELRNGAGEDYLSASAAHGARLERLAAERLAPERYLGLIEAHIEQGPGMWNSGQRLAVVTAIAGRRQYVCSLAGMANHAGATAMKDRRDALAGAAQIIGALEGYARAAAEVEGSTVFTVGRLNVRPNAVNVIPGQADFTIDLRARSERILARADADLRQIVADIAAARGLGCEIEATEELSVVGLDAGLCGHLREAAQRLGIEARDAVSGALHDTAILAPYLPAAMLFVPSKDGISHNPAEYSRVEDVALAARVIAEAVSS